MIEAEGVFAPVEADVSSSDLPPEEAMGSNELPEVIEMIDSEGAFGEVDVGSAEDLACGAEDEGFEAVLRMLAEVGVNDAGADGFGNGEI